MSIDHAYAELGLPVGASESEVKAAWRRLVSRWHPDRNPSADALHFMQRINTAYERIRNTRFTDAGLQAPPRPADAAAPAHTVRRKVRLSLEEAALGCTRVLRGRLTSACVACDGAGVLAERDACARCAGSGTVRTRSWYGWMFSQSACPACAGAGTVPRPCGDCGGAGERSSAYRGTVRLPAGVRHGDVLHAPAAGEPAGAPGAMLELLVHVAAHPFFRLDEDGTLACEMPVDAFAWMAEAWVEVPTLTGLHRMRLRRGRHVYRLRGQGAPTERRGAARGDFLVTVVPTFPDKPSAEQLALLERLAQASAEGHAPPAHAIRAWRETVQSWERGRSARRA